MNINTKLLMTFCAVILGVTGILFSFLPQELATYLGWTVGNPIVLQILGALYIGFAMMNWTAKANLVGGIYGKPIAIGNFTHFFIGALALIKSVTRNPTEIVVIVTTITYLILALLFGYILFNHPRAKKQ